MPRKTLPRIPNQKGVYSPFGSQGSVHSGVHSGVRYPVYSPSHSLRNSYRAMHTNYDNSGFSRHDNETIPGYRWSSSWQPVNNGDVRSNGSARRSEKVRHVNSRDIDISTALYSAHS